MKWGSLNGCNCFHIIRELAGESNLNQLPKIFIAPIEKRSCDKRYFIQIFIEKGNMCTCRLGMVIVITRIGISVRLYGTIFAIPLSKLYLNILIYYMYMYIHVCILGSLLIILASSFTPPSVFISKYMYLCYHSGWQ